MIVLAYRISLFFGKRSAGPEMQTDPSSRQFKPNTGAETVATPFSRSPIEKW